MRQLFLLGIDNNTLIADRTFFISSPQRERILNIERICNLLRRVSNSCFSSAGGGWLKQRGFTEPWPFVFFHCEDHDTHWFISHVARPHNTPLPLYRHTVMESTDTAQMLSAFYLKAFRKRTLCLWKITYCGGHFKHTCAWRWPVPLGFFDSKLMDK